MMIAFDLYPHKCHVCGKKFEAGVDYAYKEGYKGHHKVMWFCSYHCMREHQRKGEKSAKRYRSA